MTARHLLAVSSLLGLILAMPAQAAVEAFSLYQQHCAKCHGESGRADTWRGYLYFASSFKSQKWQEKMSDAQILEEINQGPRIMPPFAKTLTDDEKAALIRVIRQFGR